MDDLRISETNPYKDLNQYSGMQFSRPKNDPPYSKSGCFLRVTVPSNKDHICK